VDLNRIFRAPASETIALSAAEVDRRLAATDALVAGVLDGSALVGEMPPEPPTVRAKIGRVLVGIVRRAVFWLSAQIRSFQAAVAASQKEQAHLLRAEAAEIVNLRQTMEALDARMKQLASELTQLNPELREFRTGLGKLSDRVENLNALQGVSRVRTDAFQAQQETVFGQLERRINEVMVRVEGTEKIRAKQEGLHAKQEDLGRTNQTVEELKKQTSEQQALSGQLKDDLRQADRYLHHTRMQVALQERRLTTLFRETRRAGAEAPAETGSGGQGEGGASITDPIYVEFEDLFRGDRDDIKKRFEVYIPRLKDARLGHPEMAVLDLGCGRGEWLELLRDEGLTGSGIDMNLTMVEECLTRGLSVTAGEAIRHLRSLPAGSMGVVTGFHIVEHLSLDDLLALLDETSRVLRPGGMAIFETPNPSNLRVSGETFYLDPTHRNPLPKALLKFLAEARGLCDIEVLPLHPYPESYRLPDDGHPATRLLNQLLFSEQDYAVIGRKA
jgi:2-polyprenyl-3-methyl-5-hydroxy-6-metoxy-1,4-benzoquinol methylase